MQGIDVQVSQEAFGRLVGIGQSAVSDLLGRGVLPAGGTAGVWLLAYCANLRQQAAGRGGTELTQARAKLDEARRQEVELRVGIKRGEYLPLAVLEVVLNFACRQIAQKMDTIVPTLRRQFPQLDMQQLAAIDATLAACRETMANVTLPSMSDAEPDEEDDPDAQDDAGART